MSGPWEDFTNASGPWDDFKGKPTAAPSPQPPMPNPVWNVPIFGPLAHMAYDAITAPSAPKTPPPPLPPHQNHTNPVAHLLLDRPSNPVLGALYDIGQKQVQQQRGQNQQAASPNASVGLGGLFAHDYSSGADVPAAGLAAAALPGGSYRQGVAGQRAGIAAARAEHPYLGAVAETAGAITSVPAQIAQRTAAAVAPRVASWLGGILPSSIDAGLWGSEMGASEGQNPLRAGAMAALGNVAGQAVNYGLSRLISPVMSRPAETLAAQQIQLTPYQEAVRTLNDVGTQMTPGQIKGGASRSVEDALATVPYVGGFQKSAQRRSMNSFNLGAINDAISPVGQLPSNVSAGRGAIEKAQQIVSNAYDKALSGVSVPVDAQLATDLAANHTSALQTLSGDQMKAFNAVVDKHVAPFVGENITGENVQKIKQGLDPVIAKYRNSPFPADDFVADALDNVKQAVLGNMERGAPQSAAAYRAADQAYRNMAPINTAAAANKTEGIITPLQYSSAVARRGYGTTTNLLARGGANGQDIANAASIVLPAKLPSSGTAERLGILGVLGGGGAAAHLFPPAMVPAAALSIPYVPGVNRLYQAAKLAPRGPMLDALAQRLQLAAPASGMVGAALLRNAGQ